MGKVLPYKEHIPQIHETVFLADGSVVIGDVTIGKDSSVWFNTVIRGDVAHTHIGERVNIQDNSTLHQGNGKPLILEDDVSVGHQVVLHSCTIRRGALVGIGSIVMDGAEVGEGSMVGAGSFVPPGAKIPPHCVAYGSPAKVVRELTEKDKQYLAKISVSYVEKAKQYLQFDTNSKFDRTSELEE